VRFRDLGDEAIVAHGPSFLDLLGLDREQPHIDERSRHEAEGEWKGHASRTHGGKPKQPGFLVVVEFAPAGLRRLDNGPACRRR